MKFELRCEDLDKLEKVIKKFIRMSHKEYERIRPEQQERVRKITFFGKTPELPDEIAMAYVRNKDFITFGTMSALPSGIEKLFKKKMENNMRGFLEKMGCEGVEVKWVKT